MWAGLGKEAWPNRVEGAGPRGRGRGLGQGGRGLTVIFLSVQMEGRVRAA